MKNGLFYREYRNDNPILEFVVVNKNLIAKNLYTIDFPWILPAFSSVSVHHKKGTYQKIKITNIYVSTVIIYNNPFNPP